VENSLWKRLLTFCKTDYGMKERMNEMLLCSVCQRKLRAEHFERLKSTSTTQTGFTVFSAQDV
jgi:hypothetical protein